VESGKRDLKNLMPQMSGADGEMQGCLKKNTTAWRKSS
jgi:hypothetical protein